jgi:hypothetical protein
MKGTSLKRSVAAIVTAGVLSLGVAAFAATGALSPAQIVDELTPMTLEEVQAAKGEGETYGTVAKEAGVLEAFQIKMLENRKAAIEARVESGSMTREQADELLEAIDEQMASCDGTASPSERLGQKFGAAFGQGSGLRDGNGAKTGGAAGNGQGRGQMTRDGSGTGSMARGGMNRTK